MRRFLPYYVFKFSFDLMLVYPFYVLIFQNRGQGEAAIGWLLALWSASVVILELPMGVLSDRMSRKRILLASALTKAAAFALWIPAQSFTVFTAGFLLWGLSEALISGTEEAWLYESLVCRGHGDDYQKIKGRGAFCASAAIGTASILGGIVIHSGETTVLALSALACLISALSVLFFDDSPRTGDPDSEEASGGEFFPMVRSACTDIMRSRSIFILTVFASFILLLSGILEEWDPLLLTSLGITPAHLGIWLAVRYGCESLGALVAHRMNRYLPGTRSMIAVAAFTALTLPALGYFRSLALLPLYGLFYAVYALLAVQTEGRMQDMIPGSRRATVMSVKSLIDNVLGIILILATGYLAEAAGWPSVWMTAGAYVMVFCGVLFVVARKRINSGIDEQIV